MATNPMHQFEVYRIGPEIKLGNIDISFTNASLFMVVSVIGILIIFNLDMIKTPEQFLLIMVTFAGFFIWWYSSDKKAFEESLRLKEENENKDEEE